MKRSKILNVFDKISKVSELLSAWRSLETNFDYRGVDCDWEEAIGETEKAWKFDLGKSYKKVANNRFVYAPKSVCKIIENDHFVDENGSLRTTKFILVPTWVMRKW